MLVLRRKVGEEVVIGEGPDAIVLTVVDIDRYCVRLGVTAPRSVPVFRSELLPLVRPREGPSRGPD